MRVLRVVTNETCNQACRFCHSRRPHERASVAAASVVRRRIIAARHEHPTTLVLTGGEPTLRPDLPALVAEAARDGARVALETNAALVTPPLAQRLAEAGLHAAIVHLPAWGPQLDAITRDPGGAARTATGIAALRAASITVEACAPVLRDNLDSLPSLPAQLAAAGVEIERLWLRLPREAPDSESLAPLQPMLATATRLVDQARDHALPISLEPATFLPPCLFPRPGRVASIYALNRGGATRDGHARAPACAECRVRDRCPGLPDDLPPTLAEPLQDDRLRRRLTVIATPREQIERELVTREIYRRPDGSTIPAHIIRIGFRCNQNCHFCFVSTHLPAPPMARVEAAIDEIAALRGVAVFSGGEPTLDPRLVEHVRRSKAGGAHAVELQTNATRLGDPERCRELAEAGVDVAFVSLHGATAEVCDRVTAAPGTFVRTVAGVDALVGAGIRVRLNYVLCEINRHEFPAFVTMVAERWPAAAITLSFVGMSTDLVPRERWLVPRYRDVLPAVREGMAVADRRGVEVAGFDSMCGLPLCLVPDDPGAFMGLAELPAGYDGGEFVKPAPCQGCVLQSRCFGLRRGYAQMYGWDELRPVTTPPDP
ncbi:MAG: radical SAM protein [Myxococcales bacterium]|nr:radical SAM protein [Myxococcales bacterium]MCB9714782.1 radical SAM protein [Myxococcales bacterium]